VVPVTEHKILLFFPFLPNIATRKRIVFPGIAILGVFESKMTAEDGPGKPSIVSLFNANAISGFAAGSVTSAILYPLEVVKSRFQVGSHANFSYRNTFNAVSSIYRSKGIRELYRGFPAGFAGSSLSWGLYFWLYNEWKGSIAAARGSSAPGPIDHWTSSILASIAVQTVLCPLWVVKLNQQLGHVEGFWSGFFGLAKREGLKGLYRGLVPGYWASMHLALQFVLYEELKKEQFVSSLTLNTIIATVLSKSFATVVTSPIEVIKVRLRSSTVSVNENVRGICRQIYRKEGMRGFYKGVGTALIRILPGQCLTFVTFETVKRLLEK
jgi:solute carrier family 25 folate transporter 32